MCYFACVSPKVTHGLTHGLTHVFLMCQSCVSHISTAANSVSQTPRHPSHLTFSMHTTLCSSVWALSHLTHVWGQVQSGSSEHCVVSSFSTAFPFPPRLYPNIVSSLPLSREHRLTLRHFSEIWWPAETIVSSHTFMSVHFPAGSDHCLISHFCGVHISDRLRQLSHLNHATPLAAALNHMLLYVCHLGLTHVK